MNKETILEIIKKQLRENGYDGYEVKYCPHCKMPLEESVKYIGHSNVVASNIAFTVFENKPYDYRDYVREQLLEYIDSRYFSGDIEENAIELYDHLVDIGFVEVKDEM